MPDGSKSLARLSRALTKSRFATALECPTKLSYVGKPQYVNRKVADEFLLALAKGGFQVAALARATYADAEWITERTKEEQVAKTHALLARDQVTIFEAAVAADTLFARIDILRKIGRRLELYEVKAKSYETSDGNFSTSKGTIASEYLPYLRDVAFQRLILGTAYPGFELSCYLVLVDKLSQSTVDGLNQRFKVRRSGNSLETIVADGTNATTMGAPLLATINVDERVAEILASTIEVEGTPLRFDEVAARFAEAYRTDTVIGPRVSGLCAKCEFRSDKFPTSDDQRSGFHECWSSAFNWKADDFASGTVLDLYDFRSAKKTELINSGILKLQQVTPDHITIKAGEDGLSTSQRQWMQASGEWPGGGGFYLNRPRLRVEMAAWQFPLHFIDFETAMVAVPFTRDRRPYGQIAFQFSHHVLHNDGRLEHRTQYLNAKPGEFPNYEFLRALRDALHPPAGTVFRWAAHENTVLNAIRSQLTSDNSPQPDVTELVEFIDSVTTPLKGDKERHPGPRAMVDLCELAKRYFFHPATAGSCSLKKVLPALMQSSPVLQQLYASNSYGGSNAFTSLNFSEPVTWWRQVDGRLIDPYDLLPPIFDDLDRFGQKALDEDDQTNVQDGGAAMTAYARLQFEDLSVEHRERIEDALYRYCELDTLAMAMVVQAWQAEV